MPVRAASEPPADALPEAAYSCRVGLGLRQAGVQLRVICDAICDLIRNAQRHVWRKHYTREHDGGYPGLSANGKCVGPATTVLATRDLAGTLTVTPPQPIPFLLITCMPKGPGYDVFFGVLLLQFAQCLFMLMTYSRLDGLLQFANPCWIPNGSGLSASVNFQGAGPGEALEARGQALALTASLMERRILSLPDAIVL
jgi:hypothetical protein